MEATFSHPPVRFLLEADGYFEPENKRLLVATRQGNVLEDDPESVSRVAKSVFKVVRLRRKTAC